VSRTASSDARIASALEALVGRFDGRFLDTDPLGIVRRFPDPSDREVAGLLAAGLAYPKSGEGIRPAIESGLLAAQTIVEAGGRYDAAALSSYERRIVERFGERRRQRGITDFVPLPIASAVAARLFRSERFTRRVVLDGWFFHARQAALPPPFFGEVTADADAATAARSEIA